MLEVTIIYNKSNSFGLANDAKLIQKTLSGINFGAETESVYVMEYPNKTERIDSFKRV